MHPAISPQCCALLRFFQVALGQPGRAYHDLAEAFTVVCDLIALLIDDTQVHQWNGHASVDAQRYLLVHGQRQVFWGEVGQAQQRASFGHAIATVHANTTGARPCCQALCQSTAAQ
ncbi:hypothetical protein D3C77_483780 [compost metagenome]